MGQSGSPHRAAQSVGQGWGRAGGESLDDGVHVHLSQTSLPMECLAFVLVLSALYRRTINEFVVTWMPNLLSFWLKHGLTLSLSRLAFLAVLSPHQPGQLVGLLGIIPQPGLPWRSHGEGERSCRWPRRAGPPTFWNRFPQLLCFVPPAQGQFPNPVELIFVELISQPCRPCAVFPQPCRASRIFRKMSSAILEQRPEEF